MHGNILPKDKQIAVINMPAEEPRQIMLRRFLSMKNSRGKQYGKMTLRFSSYTITRKRAVFMGGDMKMKKQDGIM